MNTLVHHHSPELAIEGLHFERDGGVLLPLQDLPIVNPDTPFGVYKRDVINVHDEPYTIPEGYFDPDLQMYIEIHAGPRPGAPPTTPHGTPIWTPGPPYEHNAGGRPDGTITDL